MGSEKENAAYKCYCISGDRVTISRNQFYTIGQKRRKSQKRMVQKRKLLRREWIAWHNVADFEEALICIALKMGQQPETGLLFDKRAQANDVIVSIVSCLDLCVQSIQSTECHWRRTHPAHAAAATLSTVDSESDRDRRRNGDSDFGLMTQTRPGLRAVWAAARASTSLSECRAEFRFRVSFLSFFCI